MEIIIVGIVIMGALGIGASRQEPFDPRPRTLYEHRPVIIESPVPISGIVLFGVLILILISLVS